jgi:hypothetical protein
VLVQFELPGVLTVAFIIERFRVFVRHSIGQHLQAITCGNFSQSRCAGAPSTRSGNHPAGNSTDQPQLPALACLRRALARSSKLEVSPALSMDMRGENITLPSFSIASVSRGAFLSR